MSVDDGSLVYIRGPVDAHDPDTDSTFLTVRDGARPGARRVGGADVGVGRRADRPAARQYHVGDDRRPVHHGRICVLRLGRLLGGLLRRVERWLEPDGDPRAPEWREQDAVHNARWRGGVWRWDDAITRDPPRRRGRVGVQGRDVRTSLHIKGRRGGVMSADKVRNTINFMCRFHMHFDELTRLIPELLDDRVITQTENPTRADDTLEIYGTDAQIAIMRRIRDAVLADWQQVTVRDMIFALDVEISEEEDGAMFFDIVIILWFNWIREYRDWLASHESSESSTESSESVDDSDDMGSSGLSGESSQSVDGSDDMSVGSENESIDGFERVRRTGTRRLSRFRHRQTDMGALLKHLKNLYT